MEIEERYGMLLDPEALKDPWAGPPITPEQWMSEFRRVLTKIESALIGRLLLLSIRAHGRWVRLRPWWYSYVNRPFGATTALDVTSPAACNAKSFPVREIVGGRTFFSAVQFSPERYGHGSYCAHDTALKGGILGEDHEILFHELVHSLRHVSETWGTGGKALSGGLHDQDDVEEFIAVLVTNIYASGNRKTAMRASHHGHAVLPVELDGPYRFFQMGSQAFGVVDHFCTSNNVFCALLSAFDVPFNPIRAYFKDKAKAQRFSQNARAAQRDAIGNTLSAIQDIPFMPNLGPFEPFMKRR